MTHRHPVAIVGMGGLFPGAPDADAFWQNIVHGVDAAREVPPHRWPVPLDTMYDPEPGTLDRVFSRRGCFLDDGAWAELPASLEMDAETLRGLDPLFQILIIAGARAFNNGVTATLDRDRVGVVVGNLALPTDAASKWSNEVLGRPFEARAAGNGHASAPETNPLNRFVAGLPATILARALGLGGGACALDAACASSLYAIKLACDALADGRVDAMLAGGVARPDCLYTQMGFSQLRALSPTGTCSPFDANGNGLVVGEGAGIFLLKRLEDAVEHRDHILGVIRGIGLSNDLGGNLLAPDSEGQLRALRAAYDEAGWRPDEVDLIECHATGTPVGDAAEFASLSTLWSDSREERRAVIGSVKSNIGHLLTAAGAAALTKVLLSLQHRTLPPTANYQSPAAGVAMGESPFEVLRASRPWNAPGPDTSRKAAVSAFGFGGINAHLLIEEWIPAVKSGKKRPAKGSPEPLAIVGLGAHVAGVSPTLRGFQHAALGEHAPAPGPNNRWQDAPGLAPHGHYLDEVTVPLQAFGIPPRELEETLPQQLLMLGVAREALADAGITREQNERAGVYTGIAFDLNATNYALRWTQHDDALREAICPPLTPNRVMGALGNIVASRVARAFRFGGPSFALSSEDTSGLHALAAAADALRRGEIDHALVGAVDLPGDPRAVLGTAAARPVEATGQAHPLDRDAEGVSVGEGAVAMVVKRLADAERDGDRVYAVLHGVAFATGNASEPEVHTRALEGAYTASGVDPASVGYIETGATGARDEDAAEAHALAAYFDYPDYARSIALGSLTGTLGHMGAASGLASLARTALALHHEMIPALHGCERPCGPLDEPAGTLAVPGAPHYWLRDRVDGTRRAGVTSVAVGGQVAHAVLEGYEASHRELEMEPHPLGALPEGLFVVEGASISALEAGLKTLHATATRWDGAIDRLARNWHAEHAPNPEAPLAVCVVARTAAGLINLVDAAIAHLRDTPEAMAHGLLRDPAHRERIFFSPEPLAEQGHIAFVYPGSGNHFVGMGRDFSAIWPGIWRGQDAENDALRSQFQPEWFWYDAPLDQLHNNHHALIFGQVALGTALTDLLRGYGVTPTAAIGYSLGETASLFSLRAWTARDEMLGRVAESSLFTHELAGDCAAARRAWELPQHEAVDWVLGVIDRPLSVVQKMLEQRDKVYPLIANTLHESVVGGNRSAVESLIEQLRCQFIPLKGVTTVHCEVVREVEHEYRALHVFPVTPPPGVRFYSGAWGRDYAVTTDSAADSILAQALHGVDFPKVVDAAYADGARFFLEIGPGTSCSRMIPSILGERPHAARALCAPGQHAVTATLRTLGHLIAERIPVDREALYGAARGPLEVNAAEEASVTVRIAAEAPIAPSPPVEVPAVFEPVAIAQPAPPPPRRAPKPEPVLAAVASETSIPITLEASVPVSDSLTTQFGHTDTARGDAHGAFLKFSESAQALMAEWIVNPPRGSEIPPSPPFSKGGTGPATANDIVNRSSSTGLQERGSVAGSNAAAPPHPNPLPEGEGVNTPPFEKGGPGGISHDVAWSPDRATPATARSPEPVALDRAGCLEFARGLIGNALGPNFAAIDAYPTRVRLPDEPLMLVDRILTIEGEERSLGSGRVVTEHDILPGAWYLDAGRIPTCIAVESGQADLFLAAWLGIDFETKGLAVYRLLDATVSFHRALPVAGETIRYDIGIERFFKHGETYLFRFHFDATVNGELLLTMRGGCAGFFTQEALAAGQGISMAEVKKHSRPGTLPDLPHAFLPVSKISYDESQVDALRRGDLAACFGAPFDTLPLHAPMELPGGAMRLVHRVTELNPEGGLHGLGFIQAEADIHPDDWFLTCHFVDDMVMPGTLMYECCLHTFRVFLMRMGWVGEADTVVCEPLPGVQAQLRCRGQVLRDTKLVTYEVHPDAFGFDPSPWATATAIMYADGKPIVEIRGMSIRMSGLTHEGLRALWGGGQSIVPEPAYDYNRIFAYADGLPSVAFGEPYRVFDEERFLARLPRPPYLFLSRVLSATGEPFVMKAGNKSVAEYDVPPDAWYFEEERSGLMPYCVLVEIALQLCGWSSAYIGSALSSDTQLHYRNLGGDMVQHANVTPDAGTLTIRTEVTGVSHSGGMVIQHFTLSVHQGEQPVLTGTTYFGFFAPQALAEQIGIRDAKRWAPGAGDSTLATNYPDAAPFPGTMVRMMDRIDHWEPEGGPNGLGFIRGLKTVDPNEWFFHAHFRDDPVWPGSLGLEAMLQLLKADAARVWGADDKSRFVAMPPGTKHGWSYRGQVIQSVKEVTVECAITARDDERRIVTGEGYLLADGRPIYHMKDFAVQVQRNDQEQAP